MFPLEFGGFQLPDIKRMFAQRQRAIFADINPDKSPRTKGIESRSGSMLDLIDGLVHVVAELERQPPKQEKAA
jgi:hypothetical protein